MRVLLVNPDLSELYLMDRSIFRRWFVKHILEASQGIEGELFNALGEPDALNNLLGKIGKYFNWISAAPARTYYAPMGLLAIAANALDSGFEVRLFDMSFVDSTVNSLKDVLDEYRPHIVGFTCVTPLFPQTAYLASCVKKQFPEIVTVIGGHHATFLHYEIIAYAQSSFDIVVRGEGEYTFLEVLNALARGHKLNKVAGITYREGGKIQTNPQRPLVYNLNTLPLPAVGLLDRYRQFVYNFSLSRGCPRRCHFCSDSSMWHHRVRFFSVDRVVEEISRALEHCMGIRLYCSDSNLFLDSNQAKLLATRLGDGFFADHCSSVLIHPENVTPEVVWLMERLGFKECYVGVENTSDDVLASMGKHTSYASIRESLSTIKTNSALMVCALWIVGFPTENTETIELNKERALELLEEGLVDDIDPMFFVPHPGTAVAAHPEEFGLQIGTKSWGAFHYYKQPTFATKYFSVEQHYGNYLRFYDMVIDKKIDKISVPSDKKRDLKSSLENHADRVWVSLCQYLCDKGLETSASLGA